MTASGIDTAFATDADDFEVSGFHCPGVAGRVRGNVVQVELEGVGAGVLRCAPRAETQPPALVALRLAMTGTDDCALSASILARYRSPAVAKPSTSGK